MGAPVLQFPSSGNLVVAAAFMEAGDPSYDIQTITDSLNNSYEK